MKKKREFYIRAFGVLILSEAFWNPKDLPEGVDTDDDGMRIVHKPSTFKTMWKQLAKKYWSNPFDRVAAWDSYLEKHPGLKDYAA